MLGAKRSVVTVEEVVESFGPLSPNAVILPRWVVTALAVVPGGAHPPTPTATTSATTPSTRPGTPSPATAILSAPGCRRTCCRAGPRRFADHAEKGGLSHDRKRYTANEMMTVAAARALRNDDVCFVGIGLPSAACNLARLTHAPGITLIYESPAPSPPRPNVLPLSIGDGELCETALTTVSVPEMFRYWLQGGRITVGFLSAAQIDRFANLNTTVIGPYDKPKTRLPGGGGAPEIATACGKIFIVMSQSRRSFVERLDFITSLGHGEGGDHRQRLGVTTKGPTRLVTDLAIFEPDPDSREMTVTSLHPGVTHQAVRDATGWPVRFAAGVADTAPPPPTS
mgnify:CR=1 FL=1